MGRGQKVPAGEREFAMRDMYLQGETMAFIGAKFEVSRERVRQLLKKHFGIARKGGGHTEKTLKHTMVFSFCPFCGVKQGA